MQHSRVGHQRDHPDILASTALARLATHFALHPEANLHFHALKRATALPNRSLQSELRRLEVLRLIERRPDGRLVRFVVKDDDPRWGVLRDVVRRFVAPIEILRIALSQVADVAAAFVYGSFAAGAGIRGESDIDLFVVSNRVHDPVFRTTLAAEVLEVSGFLAREVNVSRYSPAQVVERIADQSRFVSSVLRGPKKWLVGGPGKLSHAFRLLSTASTASTAA